jgi:drug/metabolite transporter (DMT)-like permease
MASRAPHRLLPSLLGALGVMLWATETTLITYTTGIPPIQTVALAFGFAAALSPAVWLITGDGPLEAFRHPLRVWLLIVGALVAYHACIYYATQLAPPAPAALLRGTTPLMFVIGSALLPGARLRWWHVLGAGMGFDGVIMLIDSGDAAA